MSGCHPMKKLPDILDEDVSPMVKQIQTLQERCHYLQEELEKLTLGTASDSVSFNERLDKLESKTMFMIGIEQHMKRDRWITQQIDRLDSVINSLSQKKPHKCPVCDGTRFSEVQIWNRHTNEIKKELGSCISCEGKGILWN